MLVGKQCKNWPLHRGYRETILDYIRHTCGDDFLLGDPESYSLSGKVDGLLLSRDPEAELAPELLPFLWDLAAFVLDFLTGVDFLVEEALSATLRGDFEIEQAFLTDDMLEAVFGTFLCGGGPDTLLEVPARFLRPVSFSSYLAPSENTSSPSSFKVFPSSM